MLAHQTYIILLLLGLYLSGCATSSNREFSLSTWKSATPRARRQMADNFLKKYETKGLTVDQVKELLGEPDFGPDVWRYDLNADGSPVSQPRDNVVETANQYLWVQFQGLGVEEGRVTNSAEVRDGVEFDSDLGKAVKSGERVRRVGSLIQNGILQTRRKDEVRQILGEP